MPPSLSHIHTVVTAYLDRHPGERDALADLLAALDAGAEPTNRTTLLAHITCSAVVIDRHRRVLHIHHKASGGLLLAPCGHVEADDDTFLAATLHEVMEETGIPASALVLTPELRDEPDWERVGVRTLRYSVPMTASSWRALPGGMAVGHRGVWTWANW